MASYTIEDIELIRRKSGISYQEAVALLDYHNGNVARALVDLERNGRIKAEPVKTEAPKAAPRAAAAPEKKTETSFWGTLADIATKLYRMRIKIHKGDVAILNISVLFSLLALSAFWVVLVGVIICLAMGYKFSFTKDDPDFRGENIGKMVRSAADNVKASVNEVSRTFHEEAANTNKAEEKPVQKAENARSYYSAKAATAAYRPDVPTLNVPVQVESQDGSVTIKSENDGFNSATVE